MTDKSKVPNGPIGKPKAQDGDQKEPKKGVKRIGIVVVPGRVPVVPPPTLLDVLISEIEGNPSDKHATEGQVDPKLVVVNRRPLIRQYPEGTEPLFPDLFVFGPPQYHSNRIVFCNLHGREIKEVKGMGGLSWTSTKREEILRTITESGLIKRCMGFDDMIAIEGRSGRFFNQPVGKRSLPCWRGAARELAKPTNIFVPLLFEIINQWGESTVGKTWLPLDSRHLDVPIPCFANI